MIKKLAIFALLCATNLFGANAFAQMLTNQGYLLSNQPTYSLHQLEEQ